MTYEEVAQLFREHEKASTWPSTNPERFFFWKRGRDGHRTAPLRADDRIARYLWVPIDEVREHVERTGEKDSENIYYRLKRVAPANK
jgi:hypothetical protein